MAKCQKDPVYRVVKATLPDYMSANRNRSNVEVGGHSKNKFRKPDGPHRSATFELRKAPWFTANVWILPAPVLKVMVVPQNGGFSFVVNANLKKGFILRKHTLVSCMRSPLAQEIARPQRSSLR